MQPKNGKAKSHNAAKMQYYSRKQDGKVDFLKQLPVSKNLRTGDAKSASYGRSKLAIHLPPRVTGKVRQLWGFCFPTTVAFASFALWFFGGVGNSFINAKKYVFTTPNDIGTGSQTRGMFLFDLVTAENTLLPAVVQDSMSVKQVEDPVMLRILELYRRSSKQFFVAIDKGESYTDENKIPEIIKETTRLKLLPGHELFGRAWNEVTPEVKALPALIETNSEDN